MFLYSIEKTKELGRKLAPYLYAGDVILLEGELGTGKTTFTQGLAEGLGINENVTSPTFIFLNEYYSGRLPMYHMDAYRLETSEEAYEIGYERLLEGEGVVIIEWPEKLDKLIPKKHLKITFTFISTQVRSVTLKDIGGSDILNRMELS